MREAVQAVVGEIGVYYFDVYPHDHLDAVKAIRWWLSDLHHPLDREKENAKYACVALKAQNHTKKYGILPEAMSIILCIYKCIQCTS